MTQDTPTPLSPIWGDPTEVPPPRPAPAPHFSPEELLPTADREAFMRALREAEAACKAAKADRDNALARLAAHRAAVDDQARLERAHAIATETLALRDQEIQALTIQLDAMTASVTQWYGKHMQAKARQREYARELRTLLEAQTGLFRFIWRLIRRPALTQAARKEHA